MSRSCRVTDAIRLNLLKLSTSSTSATSGNRPADYTRDALGRVTGYTEKDASNATIYSRISTYGTGETRLLLVSETEVRGSETKVTTFDCRLDTTNSAWNGTTRTHGTYNGTFIGQVTHTRTVTNGDLNGASELEYDYV